MVFHQVSNLEVLKRFNRSDFSHWLLNVTATGSALPMRIPEYMHIAEFLVSLERDSDPKISNMIASAVIDAIFSWKRDVHGFGSFLALCQCMSYLKATGALLCVEQKILEFREELQNPAVHSVFGEIISTLAGMQPHPIAGEICHRLYFDDNLDGYIGLLLPAVVSLAPNAYSQLLPRFLSVCSDIGDVVLYTMALVGFLQAVGLPRFVRGIADIIDNDCEQFLYFLTVSDFPLLRMIPGDLESRHTRFYVNFTAFAADHGLRASAPVPIPMEPDDDRVSRVLGKVLSVREWGLRLADIGACLDQKKVA